MNVIRVLVLFTIVPLLLAANGSSASDETGSMTAPASDLPGWCSEMPRPENAALPEIHTESDWFQVYQAAEGVYALVEARQWEETISYLILGREKALLFDTGLGVMPIRPVVERLTDLPIVVINSHTHFDHVGGNFEFDTILAVDSDYTRANMAGFSYQELKADLVPEAFCAPPYPDWDAERFATRPWKAERFLEDGEIMDLGGRKLEVLLVPGHTPDAIALLDRANGLLWTGDSYYDGTLWLFVPETDLDAYQASIERMNTLVPDVQQLLPAHNTASVAPSHLSRTLKALGHVRSGRVIPVVEEDGRLVYEAFDIRILTSRQALNGERSEHSNGGSGLSTWPPGDELAILLHRFLAGASANEREAHDTFWAEDLVYSSSSGERFGKAEIMSGFDDEAEAASELITVYTAEDIRIRYYGDAATVAFRLIGTTDEEPSIVTEYFNTGTFLRRDGRWQVVAWQATRIPAPE